jgi:hypothetical protein
LGQANAAGDSKALFLKLYAGEVLAAFLERNVALQRSQVRSISAGKSSQFPVYGKGTASYHTPGTELVGTAVVHNEVIVTVDDLLVADRFIASIDEAMNHYDVRSIYSKDVGRALAKELDKHLLQLGINAANDSATYTGGNAGTVITDADANTSGSSLAGSIFQAAMTLDQKDVPEDGRTTFVMPAQWSLLVQLDKALDRDFSDSSAGDYARRVLTKVAGTELVWSNNMPNGNSIATGPTAYQGDYTYSISLTWHNSCVGTVKLMDLAVESEWDIRRQGTLVVAKMAVGSGVLRPDAAVEVQTA